MLCCARGKYVAASSINKEPVTIPAAEEARIAEIRRVVEKGAARIADSDGHQFALPDAVRDLLLKTLKSLEDGKAVSIIAEHQNLTTQRAANILGVSRPFLVRLLEEGEIPFHMVGVHRRIYLHDLLEYKRRRDNTRHDALNRMAKADREDGIYEKVVLPEDAEEE
jgi:excisionase family DNA binding protein